jgi:cation diffusion facilitator family transporter
MSGSGTQRRQKQVRRALWTFLALNLLTAAIKTAWGVVSRSSAMFADGIHSLSAALGNLVGLTAMFFIGDAHDEARYPQGHLYEHIASAAVGVIMLAVAARIGWTSGESLVSLLAHGVGPAVQITPASFAVMAVCIAINLSVVWYARKTGRASRSPVLMAAASHTLSDVWSTCGVVISSVLVKVGFPVADSVVGLAIAGIIAFSAFGILRNAAPAIMGK